MKFLRLAAELLGIFVCVATVLPFIRTDEWWVRMFDFPRLQLLLMGFLSGLLLAVCFQFLTVFHKVLAGVLLLALAVQAVEIFPYTPLSPKQVNRARPDEGTSIKVFVANVLQDNRNARDLLKQIDALQPDMILLNEPDSWWTEQMVSIETRCPHTILHPRTNTYGMNFYSRFELADPQVRFLTYSNVPSIRVKLRLPDGRLVYFYGVHPRPPGSEPAGVVDRTDSTQRDAELVLIGREVRELEDVPVIVAGDFNDVAWSSTTRLFQRLSGLLDPRVGRGFYNTYNAKLWCLRFPLDHLFHSEHFKLVEMRRLYYFGSDHFPIAVTLSLQPEAPAEQDRPDPKPSDEKKVQKILERPHKD